MNTREIRQEDKPRRAQSEQVSALRALFVDAEPTERLGANRSFPVQDIEQAWFVLEGAVDLFVSWRGRRHHLVRVECGTAIFGLADALNELTVFAVPGNGAVLLPTTRRQMLDALSRRDPGSQAVRIAVAAWVAELTAIGLAHAEQDVARLSPNCPASIVSGGSLWSPDGSLCVDLPTDVLVFPDGTPFEPFNGGVVGVPLNQEFWFRTNRDIEVVPILLEEWLGRPQIIADLDCLHALALDIQRRLISGRERALAEALGDWTKREDIRLSESIRLLAATNTDRALPLASASSNSYIAAAALVLDAVGSGLPQSGSAERAIRSARDPVFAIASACGLLYRKVHLVEDWWNRDHGPILAVLREEGTACALLPKSATSYWLVDPERGERQLLTADLAARLSGEAYTFVTPLPEEPVSGLALLKFGSQGFRQDISALIGTILVIGLLSMVTPVVTGWIMNPVIPYAQSDQLAVLAIALVIAGLASFAFSLIQNVAVLRLEGGMNARVAAAVWDRLLRLPAGFFRRFSVGDLANRALGVDQIRQIVSSTVMASILHSTAGLMSLGLMFYYNNKLALVVSGVAALYVAISFVIAREVRSRNREIAEKMGRLQGFVVQLLNAVTRLRVSGAEGAAFTQWSRQYASLMATTYHQLRLNNLQTVFQSLFNFLTLLAVFVAVGLASGKLFAAFHEPKDWSSLTATIATVLPPSIFVAFNVAYGQFIASVFGLAKSWISLLNVGPLHQRAQPILEAAVETRGSAQDPGEIIGNVEIRDIHFRYAPDSPPVLNGVTLLAEAGKLIAVVGPSGAGKSSLVRLLLGFDDPQRGSIFIDGKDIRHLNKRALRQQFGVVLQNGRVLSGSVYHNITAGAHVSREEAWEAARIAGLDKDIRAMPMGMDTFLNEGASTISGGQRQRLMIARAVVRRPKLLIFDEATSALDNQTQEEVRRNLEKMNCTRIVIAHRLSSIANADRIYVLDGGQVVEQGSAAELMALNGRFAELALRQIA